MSRGKTEVVIMPEEQVYDEADIREYIEFIRKHPVKFKPKLIDCWDWDVFCLKAKSYNRHNKNLGERTSTTSDLPKSSATITNF